MNEKSLLQHQVQTTLDQLELIEGWLDHPAINAQMRQRARASFRSEIKTQRLAWQALQQTLNQNNVSLPPCWEQLRQLRAACQFLFREFSAFWHGALTRNAGIDHHLCHIADALLDELSQRCGLTWNRFTILADAEQFFDLVGIIRLPFPETTFWTLPLAAHEFGHFVAKEMQGRSGGRRSYPIEEFIQQEGQADPKRIAHLNDLFADVFAAYSLGPAYAYAMLLLRLDPAKPDSFNHPSSARRAYIILKTLNLLGTDQPMPPFAAVADWLGAQWRSLRQSANQPPELDDAEQQQLNSWATRLVQLLRNNLLDEAAYNRWPRAASLSTNLMSGQEMSAICRPDDALTDILNAAWRCRLENWNQADDIGIQAMAACLHLARHL